MKTSVFIVDDHYMVVEGIRSLLQDEQDLVWLGHAMDGLSCFRQLETLKPDIVFMDINLPDISGIELCKTVKKKLPQTKILGLSTYNQQAIIHNMMENGASGYLLKNASKEELLEAIKTVKSGGQYLCLEATRSLLEPGYERPLITRREKEVLILICDGLTNPEIAEKLFISLPTANTHRKSLLAKFGAKNVAALVKTAVQEGFV